MIETIFGVASSIAAIGAVLYSILRASMIWQPKHAIKSYKKQGLEGSSNVVLHDHGVALKDRIAMVRRLTGRHEAFLYVFGSDARVERVLDGLHPRSREIQEHKEALQLLEGIQGDAAIKQRRLLENGLKELYGSVQRQDEIDGDAYVAYITPELDALHELRQTATEAYFGTRVDSQAKQQLA